MRPNTNTPTPPETLTSVQVFNFHRNTHELYYGDRAALTIGAYPDCDIQLEAPTLYKGLISIDDTHLLSYYESPRARARNAGGNAGGSGGGGGGGSGGGAGGGGAPANETRRFSPPESAFTVEKNGVLLTVKRSWRPFTLLIDTLIESVGLNPDRRNSEDVRALIRSLVPPAIAATWPIETIWPHIQNHQNGYGDISELMTRPDVTEILINGCQSVYYESNGRFYRLPESLTPLRIERLITRLIQHSGRVVNTKHPIVDLQLPTGERVNIILAPVSKIGPVISIRRFQKSLNTLEALSERGTMSETDADRLRRLVRARKNIVISGGTGSGKTTLLNALLSACESSERLIIVEDSSELSPQHPHWLNLETRPARMDSDVEISMSTLIKNTLRMRPTRVICGECRGPEAFQMLLAMNSGHPGSMTTIHANSPMEALSRLEIFLLMAGFDVPHRAIRHFISSAIDCIIQMNHIDAARRGIARIVTLDKAETERYVLNEAPEGGITV